MKAAIYARYSSDKQTEDSIEAQLRACNEYASGNGLDVVRVYADRAMSGKNDRRPEFQKMMRDADSGLFSTLLIHKYNRFARRVSDHVRYEDRLSAARVELIAVAENFGHGKEAIIMKALMRSLSEYYIADLADETRKGLRETALKGLHTGGVAPFGYDVVEQKYVVNELEAFYVQKIFSAARQCLGFVDIVQEMHERGICGKRGKPIKYTQIYEMLRNEKYTGVYTYSSQEESNRSDRRAKPNAIRLEGAIPAIIEKTMFQEVQKIMDGRKQTGKKTDYLCSGRVYCECGAKMHVYKSSKNGRVYAYYKCSEKCGAPSIRVSAVDDAAYRYLKSLLSKHTQKEITDSICLYQSQAGESKKIFKKALHDKISEKQRQYDALFKNLSSGELPPAVVNDIGVKLQTLQDEIIQLKNAPIPEDFTPAQITGWLESIKEAPDERAVRLLIDRINIKNKIEFSISSTLNSILGKHGCGNRI